jgi:hypothetical protein
MEKAVKPFPVDVNNWDTRGAVRDSLCIVLWSEHVLELRVIFVERCDAIAGDARCCSPVCTVIHELFDGARTFDVRRDSCMWFFQWCV